MDYKYLKNFRNLKAFFKGASSSEIKSIVDKLNQLYENVKSFEQEQLEQKEQKSQFLSSLLNQLDDHNFTVDDLAALKGLKVQKDRAKMKPKYRYQALDGKIYTWSGQGKIPSLLKELMESEGISDKNVFRIESD